MKNELANYPSYLDLFNFMNSILTSNFLNKTSLTYNEQNPIFIDKHFTSFHISKNYRYLFQLFAKVRNQFLVIELDFNHYKDLESSIFFTNELIASGYTFEETTGFKTDPLHGVDKLVGYDYIATPHTHYLDYNRLNLYKSPSDYEGDYKTFWSTIP
jgi:hypothetical protein